MANAEHLAKLKEGVEAWNKWREEHPEVIPDLRNVDLREAELKRINLYLADLESSNLEQIDLAKSNLSKANLAHSILTRADLFQTNLIETNLSSANLEAANLGKTEMRKANLQHANLSRVMLYQARIYKTNLQHANLVEAKLNLADLADADLRYADLTGADLTRALLVGTDLSGSTIRGARIYGISSWDIKKEGTIQEDLIITPENEPPITVDDLEIAQFIYLLLNNQKFRDVIETVTSKAVLILGRFTKERKVILDAMRDELRKKDFLPILFDFEKPASRDLTETISILAKMSRFVIADLTDAKSIPQELSHIIPFTPSLPVIPIILKGQFEYAMFEHWKPYKWVLPIYKYRDEEHLISTLSAHVIEPAERKVKKIRKVK